MKSRRGHFPRPSPRRGDMNAVGKIDFQKVAPLPGGCREEACAPVLKARRIQNLVPMRKCWRMPRSDSLKRSPILHGERT